MFHSQLRRRDSELPIALPERGGHVIHVLPETGDLTSQPITFLGYFGKARLTLCTPPDLDWHVFS
jgi:hypothetical protein